VLCGERSEQEKEQSIAYTPTRPQGGIRYYVCYCILLLYLLLVAHP